MKNKLFLLLPVIPIILFITGYYLKEYGFGFLMLLGAVTFLFSLFVTFVLWTGEKCPNCNNFIILPYENDIKRRVRCPKCGRIIK